jgi:hypothetical protein
LDLSWRIKVCDEITSAVIPDGENIYFGGMDGANPKIYGYVVATQAQLFAVDGSASGRVTATPSWAEIGGIKYLFLGSDAPNPRVFRVNVPGKAIDLQNTSPTDHVRAPTAYWDWAGTTALFVGDYAGRMQGVSPTTFTNLSGFPALPSYEPSSITSLASILWLGGPNIRLLYGDMGGYFYDRNFDGTHYDPPDGPPYPLQLGSGTPIESSPLPGIAGIYIGNNNGQVFVISETLRSVIKTYSFGNNVRIGPLSYDQDHSRVLVPTDKGKIYYLDDN